MMPGKKSLIRDLYEKYDYIAGLAMAAAIFVVMWYILGLNFVIIALAAVCISAVFERMMRSFKHEDERSLKVVAFACMNSLVATLVVLGGMTWMDIIHLLPSYRISDILVITSFIMFLVFVLWIAYYWRRGDVE